MDTQRCTPIDRKAMLAKGANRRKPIGVMLCGAGQMPGGARATQSQLSKRGNCYLLHDPQEEQCRG